jgi:hypothetical protein
LIVDPENRTVEILTLERDALHSRQTASGEGEVISPVLDNAAFSVAEIFAGLDDLPA